MADKKKVSWVDSSDPSIYHFFSPFKQHGLLNKAEKVNRNWQVSLENGWMQPEKNSRLDRQGTYRMLIGPDGRPYTAPNGPARGKFIAFDAWQSNDELMTIYKMAFEEPYEEGYADAIDYTGMARTGNKQSILQNWKGDGHIKEVSYNSSFECMMVNFENKDAVVCYLGVPQGTIDMLRQCVGQAVAGHGKHNHLLGIKFWDYVRIRGTKHGSRYPFWYVTDKQGHTYESTVSKLKRADVENYMQKLQASNIARLKKWNIEQKDIHTKLWQFQDILDTEEFQDDFENDRAAEKGVSFAAVNKFNKLPGNVFAGDSNSPELKEFWTRYGKDVDNAIAHYSKYVKESSFDDIQDFLTAADRSANVHAKMDEAYDYLKSVQAKRKDQRTDGEQKRYGTKSIEKLSPAERASIDKELNEAMGITADEWKNIENSSVSALEWAMRYDSYKKKHGGAGSNRSPGSAVWTDNSQYVQRKTSPEVKERVVDMKNRQNFDKAYKREYGHKYSTEYEAWKKANGGGRGKGDKKK